MIAGFLTYRVKPVCVGSHCPTFGPDVFPRIGTSCQELFRLQAR